jgi:hypothetical protein
VLWFASHMPRRPHQTKRNANVSLTKVSSTGQRNGNYFNLD